MAEQVNGYMLMELRYLVESRRRYLEIYSTINSKETSTEKPDFI